VENHFKQLQLHFTLERKGKSYNQTFI